MCYATYKLRFSGSTFGRKQRKTIVCAEINVRRTSMKIGSVAFRAPTYARKMRGFVCAEINVRRTSIKIESSAFRAHHTYLVRKMRSFFFYSAVDLCTTGFRKMWAIASPTLQHAVPGTVPLYALLRPACSFRFFPGHAARCPV